jgi:hypothetical protein
MLKILGRILILIVALLVIVLSLGGIFGAWWLSNTVSDVTLKVFSVVRTGTEVVDSAVGRVDTLVQTARSEVQQTGDMITTAASNLQENHPVLTALNERLDTRLGPTVDNIQQTLAPVHDVLVTVSSAVSFANSIPFIQERAPRLEQLDQTFTRLGALAADVQQLRSTLRAAVVAGADKLTQTTATALTDLTSRIDAGLADIQSSVQTLQSDITALQVRMQERLSRLLLIYNLSALATTLLFVWVIYSQVVVVRHHWSRSRNAAPKPVPPAPVAETASAEAGAQPPAKIAEGGAVSQSVDPVGSSPVVSAQPETGLGADAAPKAAPNKAGTTES